MTTGLQIPALEGVTEKDKQDFLRDVAGFHNRHAGNFSEIQAQATQAALAHAGIAVLDLTDGRYALSKRDLDAVGAHRLAGVDRQGADQVLAALKDAERNRQHAAEVRQESETRKARERGQDSGSDWG